ncbi:MAG: hypothetical protein JOY64_34385 [Alphaproteobacteria bacterium]|nr:hypothetical protein [Alphaproteobacteria bacterium]MBV8412755.1 hypothetical protein [Alphaproteobacteria bacterium]
MFRPIPFSLLVPDQKATDQKASDQKAYVAEAHRLRGVAVAGLIRDFVRWLSAASR